MGRHNGITALGFGAGLLSLAGASIAWACSSLAPSAYVTANPTEANPGQQVQVSTHNMNVMVGTDARLIWADAYNNYISTLGPVPASDSTTTVTVPSAAPGYYYINVYEGQYRATPQTLTIPLPDGGRPGDPPPNYGQPDTTSFSLGGAQQNNRAPGATAVTSAPTQRQSQQAPAPVAVRSAPAPQGSTIAPKATIVSSGSSTPASATSATPIQGAPVQPAAGGNVPANKVLGDLWGGFAKGRTNSQAPSLIAVPGSGPGVGLAVGMGTAGLVALVAGFGIAEVRRSRALATSTIE